MGVACVGAPLLQNGKLIAAVALSSPAERMENDRAELTKVLLELTAGATEGDHSATDFVTAAV